jgi:cell division protein FtsQ
MVIKKTIIKRVFTILWIAIGVGTIVLLAAAIRKKDAQHCSGVNITIEGVDNNFFVDKKDIINSIKLTVGGSPVGKAVSSFDLRKIESQLEKDIWVKAAQLFFDNNNRLMVYVLEREPVARVFTTGGTTFYIDTSLAMLPLSEKFSARLPVFTDFPSDKIVLSKADSALLKDILTISMAIQKDTFNMAMIDQVDITPQRSFEMIPKIGNNIIVFGDATNVEEKFYKLQLFYRQVMVKAGWSKYSEVNVQYKGQVVAKIKGAQDKAADSLRTLQLMQQIAENAERLSNDSLHMIAQDNENNTTDINLVQQSIQRDEDHGPATNEKPEVRSTPDVVKPAVVKPTLTTPKPKASTVKIPLKPKPIIVKPFVKPNPANTEKPKALLPKPITKPVVTKPVIKKTANEY